MFFLFWCFPCTPIFTRRFIFGFRTCLGMGFGPRRLFRFFAFFSACRIFSAWRKALEVFKVCLRTISFGGGPLGGLGRRIGEACRFGTGFVGALARGLCLASGLGLAIAIPGMGDACLFGTDLFLGLCSGGFFLSAASWRRRCRRNLSFTTCAANCSAVCLFLHPGAFQSRGLNPRSSFSGSTRKSPFLSLRERTPFHGGQVFYGVPFKGTLNARHPITG